VAWYASCLGGQHRDQAAPPLRWNWSRGGLPPVASA
jgi:hypothetical protein